MIRLSGKKRIKIKILEDVERILGFFGFFLCLGCIVSEGFWLCRSLFGVWYGRWGFLGIFGVEK